MAEILLFGRFPMTNYYKSFGRATTQFPRRAEIQNMLFVHALSRDSVYGNIIRETTIYYHFERSYIIYRGKSPGDGGVVAVDEEEEQPERDGNLF